MKELLAHGSNLLLAPELDKPLRVSARIELILICSEPTYTYGVDGLSRAREVSDMRLLCGHRTLREMAGKLIALADEAQSLETAMNGRLDAEEQAK